MNYRNIDRGDFIKKTGVMTGGALLATNSTFSTSNTQPVNKLPKWKGFNFLDFYSPNPRPNRRRTKEDYFKWMQD